VDDDENEDQTAKFLMVIATQTAHVRLAVQSEYSRRPTTEVQFV